MSSGTDEIKEMTQEITSELSTPDKKPEEKQSDNSTLSDIEPKTVEILDNEEKPKRKYRKRIEKEIIEAETKKIEDTQKAEEIKKAFLVEIDPVLISGIIDGLLEAVKLEKLAIWESAILEESLKKTAAKFGMTAIEPEYCLLLIVAVIFIRRFSGIKQLFIKVKNDETSLNSSK